MAALLREVLDVHVGDVAVREGACWLLVEDVACVRAGALVRLRQDVLQRCQDNLGAAAGAEAAALSAVVDGRSPDGWLRVSAWRPREAS
jgi:hypothetical protein